MGNKCNIFQQGCGAFSVICLGALLYEVALEFNFSSVTQNYFVLVSDRNGNSHQKNSFHCTVEPRSVVFQGDGENER